jgi:hypothetical protein
MHRSGINKLQAKPQKPCNELPKGANLTPGGLRILASKSITQSQKTTHDNPINSDGKKRRSFVAPLFAAGYERRYASQFTRGNMKRNGILFSFFVGLMSSGCASTTMQTYHAGGDKAVCGKRGVSLGHVAILPEMAWRNDQKEPEKREQMALEEIERAFREIPCGSIAAPGGIRQVSDWSGRPESELVSKFSEEGVDTVILVRIEELTPRIFVTYSLPFLWAGSSEADFRIRTLSVQSGSVLADMRVKRSTGGPFNLRPAEWAGTELNAALRAIIEEKK